MYSAIYMLPNCKLISVLTGFRTMPSLDIFFVTCVAALTLTNYFFKLFLFNVPYSKVCKPCLVPDYHEKNVVIPSPSYGNVTKIFLSMQNVQSCKYDKQCLTSP